MACITTLLTISPAEERVLVLLLDGSSNRQIAARLGLSPRTVESHIGAMFDKTGCRNRSQLLLWGLRQGRTNHVSMNWTAR
jgi:DNA-binding CsgD family transcriptional regulator